VANGQLHSQAALLPLEETLLPTGDGVGDRNGLDTLEKRKRLDPSENRTTPLLQSAAKLLQWQDVGSHMANVTRRIGYLKSDVGLELSVDS
jgi:hypothetical protein